MALCLSKTLGRPPESWLSTQRNYNFLIVGQKVDLTGVEKPAMPSERQPTIPNVVCRLWGLSHVHVYYTYE